MSILSIVDVKIIGKTDVGSKETFCTNFLSFCASKTILKNNIYL